MRHCRKTLPYDLGVRHWCKTFAYLCLVVEVPEVEPAHAVDAGEERGVDGRPLHAVHVVAVVLERVDELLVLRTTKETFHLTTHSTYFSYAYMEGRKEMFYLTTDSTHFIYGYMEGKKEGNGLFNDAFNTF